MHLLEVPLKRFKATSKARSKTQDCRALRDINLALPYLRIFCMLSALRRFKAQQEQEARNKVADHQGISIFVLVLYAKARLMSLNAVQSCFSLLAFWCA